MQRGDQVRIAQGPMADRLAIYDGMKGSERVLVLLTMLGSLQRVEMPKSAIEAVPVDQNAQLDTNSTQQRTHFSKPMSQQQISPPTHANSYKGAAAAITDLLGGQIEVMFTTVASVAPYVQSGQLRALAVTSAERSAAFPDLPTVAESGVPGYAAESWYGLYAPAGTPADVIARLNTSVARAVGSPAFKSLEQVEGLTVAVGPPAQLDRYVRGEAARWQKLISMSNIKSE